MAEFGDALSTAITSQTDGSPSIFEVLAQDSLNTSIRPAIKHICKVLAQSAPHHFGWFYYWFDEFQTIVECFIQHYFLLNNKASFAEHYYDLERKPLNKSTPNSVFPLGKRLHFLSITALAIFPYIEVKLEEKYKFLKEEFDLKGPGQFTYKQWILLTCYPYLHMLWHGVVLYYNFMYAIGKSHFYSPLYRLLNITLIPVNPFDSTSNSQIGPLSRVFSKLLTGGVHLGVFIIQFIEWWYNDTNENSIKDVMKRSIPFPPESKVATNIPVPPNGICPLCNRHLKNDTALMTSGYVFCYVCIYKHVKAKRRCPVTGYRTDTNHLVKLYPPT